MYIPCEVRLGVICTLSNGKKNNLTNFEGVRISILMPD